MSALSRFLWQGNQRGLSSRARRLYHQAEGRFDRAVRTTQEATSQAGCLRALDIYATGVGSWSQWRATTWDVAGLQMEGVIERGVELADAGDRAASSVKACLAEHRPWSPPQIVFSDMEYEWPGGGGVPRKGLLEF